MFEDGESVEWVGSPVEERHLVNQHGKESSAQRAASPTISEWMDVRDKSKVCAIASFEKERHSSHESEHGGVRLGVEDADCDLESTADDTQGVEPYFLVPHAACLAVDEIGDEATCGTEDDVQEAEHCCPATGTGLKELGEVVEIVGAENGVDGELSTEGAEVAERYDSGLRCEDNGHCFLEARLDDDFSAGGIQHCLLGNDNFVVKITMLSLGDAAFFFPALLIC